MSSVVDGVDDAGPGSSAACSRSATVPPRPSSAGAPEGSLPGAVVDGGVVDGAVVDGAVVDGAVVEGAVVEGAVVEGAVVDGAVVDGAVVDGAVVDGAVVDGVVDGVVVVESVSSGTVSPVTLALLPSVVEGVPVVDVVPSVVEGPAVVGVHGSVVDELRPPSAGVDGHTTVDFGTDVVDGGGGVTGAESMVVLVMSGWLMVGPAGAVVDGLVDLVVSLVVGRCTVGGVGPGPVLGGVARVVVGGFAVDAGTCCDGGGFAGADVVGPAGSTATSIVVVGCSTSATDDWGSCSTSEACVDDTGSAPSSAIC